MLRTVVLQVSSRGLSMRSNLVLTAGLHHPQSPSEPAPCQELRERKINLRFLTSIRWYEVHTILLFDIQLIHDSNIRAPGCLHTIFIRGPLCNPIWANMGGEVEEIIFAVLTLIKTGSPFSVDGRDCINVRTNLERERHKEITDPSVYISSSSSHSYECQGILVCATMT